MLNIFVETMIHLWGLFLGFFDEFKRTAFFFFFLQKHFASLQMAYINPLEPYGLFL